MAKKLANDYWLWVESTTPGTFNFVKGQRSLSVGRSASKIDTTSKADVGYGTSAPGLRDLNLTMECIPDLPDTTGYTRLEALSLASPQVPFNIQIRKGAASGNGTTDVVFQGSVYGNVDSSGFNQNEAVSVNFTFYAAAAPTTDLLA
jgi:hypothetical protein